MVLMLFMAAMAIAMARVRDLFAVVMLSGVFSLTAAAIYVVLDAVDVAFTEAAVGAGISTVLMLATLALTTRAEKASSDRTKSLPALFVVLFTGAILVYGTFDMPHYGDKTAPIHSHVAPRYIEKSGDEVGLPNIVTSILASYRGYDTLGEVFVIFTAATGVLAILGRTRRRRRNEANEDARPATGGPAADKEGARP